VARCALLRRAECAAASQAQAQGSLVSYPVSSALGYPGTSTSPAQVDDRWEGSQTGHSVGGVSSTGEHIQAADDFVASGYSVAS
jgi:hypothetical protein